MTSKHFRVFWIIYLAIGILVFIFFKNSVTQPDLATISDKSLWYGILSGALAGLYVVYFIFSFYQIGPNEIGCVLHFGKPLFQVGPGLAFVPKFIYTLERESKLELQMQFPENEKDIPIRIMHGKLENQLDSLGQITTPVTIVVRYKIKDFVAFIQTIGSRGELKNQIHKVVEAKARYEFMNDTFANNLISGSKIDDLLKKAMAEFTTDWGIEIVSFLTTKIDTTAIDGAMEKVYWAEYAKKEAIILAEGQAQAEKIKLEFKGAGEAKALKLMLYAKASGYKEIAKQLKMDDGKVMIIIDLISGALKDGKVNLNHYGIDVTDINKVIGVVKNIDSKE